MKQDEKEEYAAYRGFCASVARLERRLWEKNFNHPRARFIHCSLGHEPAAFFVTKIFPPEQALWALYYRSHAWLLAFGVSATQILAQIMGDCEHLRRKRAGSMHLFLHPHVIDCNSIVGAQIPIAVGAAIANRKKALPVVCVLGDGATNTGVFYEAINIASLYSAPILFVVENNCMAMDSPYERTAVSTIRAKFELFSIPFFAADGQDLKSVSAKAAEACAIATRKPATLCITNERVGPHVLSSFERWPLPD